LRPKLFRYPYLRAGDRLRRRIAGQAFRELGYKVAPCHVDTADWRLPVGTVTFEEVERRALTAGPGDVVLLHETAFAAPLLERVLPVLAGRYELCSLAGTVSSPRPGEIADDGLRENRQKESPAHPGGDS
jgi:peptidoglycan/xylan/chitin deacetylase (PgdA/CDA1 family)